MRVKNNKIVTILTPSMTLAGFIILTLLVLIQELRHLDPWELILLGTALMIAAYHLVLYLLRPQVEASLFFSGYAVLVGLRALLSPISVYAVLLNSGGPTGTILDAARIAYLAEIAAGPLLALYVQRTYPRFVSGIGFVVLGAAFFAQAGLLYLLPPEIRPYSVILYQIVLFLVFLAIVIQVIWAARRGSSCGWATAGGVVFLGLFLIHDLALAGGLIESRSLLAIGLLGFLLSQAIVIAVHLNQAYRSTELLQASLERQVEARTRELEELVRRDELTGLHNRRHANEILGHELHRYLRYGTPVTVILLDVDHFKRVNDTRGHQVGDQVLKVLARVLTESTRAADVVCRWGGEEFLLMLPDTSPEDGINLARKIRKTIADYPVPLEQSDGSGTSQGITVSIGVTGLLPRSAGGEPSQPERPHDTVLLADVLIRDADNALYAAKHQGRNRVCSALK